MANRLAFYLRNKGEDSIIRIFGRLDKDTSGVVLAAKSRAAAGRLRPGKTAGNRKTKVSVEDKAGADGDPGILLSVSGWRPAVCIRSGFTWLISDARFWEIPYTEKGCIGTQAEQKNRKKQG